MVDKTTTIRINKKTKEILDSNKIYPRETYDDLIKKRFKRRR